MLIYKYEDANRVFENAFLLCGIHLAENGVEDQLLMYFLEKSSLNMMAFVDIRKGFSWILKKYFLIFVSLFCHKFSKLSNYSCTYKFIYRHHT
jgi:hypothetical protein